MSDLNHSGILGMKWGKRNGPPYPLSYKKLSAEEKAKAKESAIRRGDINEVHANRDHYSDQEVNAAINRYTLNTRLNELYGKQYGKRNRKGSDFIDKFSNGLGKYAKLVDNGTKAYNTTALILNNTLGSDLKKIEWKNKDKDKNKNN